ncbi:MAG: hypothetical protein A3H29_19255 [Acidobacteria bacterium RIFCSPLOWO2_02_FULL_67_21]|nr:MAG: hypothetical protein A3H29_19255 [Acidobacteria bacterium RIFCSPLOWO2_02_FULL_67_21]
MRPGRSLIVAALLAAAAAPPASFAGARQSGGGAPPRRLTAIAALRQYPAYFHLQNVLVHGEFAGDEPAIVLRGGDHEVTVILNDARTRSGLVEVRGQLFDLGRMDPADPRLGAYQHKPRAEDWPRPGEELVLNVTSVSEGQYAATPSIRALALQPWRFVGQKVTVAGEFRGRNLFGDLPSAPGRSRYDFVLRSADAAIWVTDLRPRGRGFDLSVDARVDTGRWLEVTGTVSEDRGLVAVAGTALAATTAPEAETHEEEPPAPPPPPEPGEVVFSSPTEGETDVPVAGTVRVQFSRGVDPASLPDRIRVTYVGSAEPPPPFTYTYDAAARAVEIRFANPLQSFRTIRVEMLEGIRTFDGAPVQPWNLTFSVGG